MAKRTKKFDFSVTNKRLELSELLSRADNRLLTYTSWNEAINTIDTATTFEELEEGMKKIANSTKSGVGIPSKDCGGPEKKAELNKFANNQLQEIQRELADQNNMAKPIKPLVLIEQQDNLLERLSVFQDRLGKYKPWNEAINRIETATTFEELQAGMKEIAILTTPGAGIPSKYCGGPEKKAELNTFANNQLEKIEVIQRALADQNNIASKKATNPFKSFAKALLKQFQRIGQFLKKRSHKNQTSFNVGTSSQQQTNPPDNQWNPVPAREKFSSGSSSNDGQVGITNEGGPSDKNHYSSLDVASSRDRVTVNPEYNRLERPKQNGYSALGDTTKEGSERSSSGAYDTLNERNPYETLKPVQNGDYVTDAQIRAQENGDRKETRGGGSSPQVRSADKSPTPNTSQQSWHQKEHDSESNSKSNDVSGPKKK